ncbi:MAG TPA: TIGR03089 family protein [Frankiaceae bacterium]|nr:TIGR03089 family protein [Frankiaceae bacterium]
MAPVPIDRLLVAALRADPSGPFLTFYDDATGERVELSLTSLENWVAKTANLLVDELDLEPGEPVLVDLPAHWQTAVIWLGVALAGGHVVEGRNVEAGVVEGGVVESDAGSARIAFFAEGAAQPAADELVGLGLRPLGGGLRMPRRGVLDYAREVPTHGDRFAAVAAAVVETGEPIPDRLLTPSLEPLLAVLAGSGSLVLCRNPDLTALTDRASTERATATWGLDLPGLPRRG